MFKIWSLAHDSIKTMLYDVVTTQFYTLRSFPKSITVNQIVNSAKLVSSLINLLLIYPEDLRTAVFSLTI
jgi:hypothetical protein